MLLLLVTQLKLWYKMFFSRFLLVAKMPKIMTKRTVGEDGRGTKGEGRLGGDWGVKGKGGICDRTEWVV